MAYSFLVVAASAFLGSVEAANVTWYPPTQTNLNNLTFALNGTGTPSNGIFNSSTVSDEEYGVYNWCNMPHVRSTEYQTPPEDFQLLYVEVLQRHHKRTPYASNTFPTEDIGWDCLDSGAVYAARNGVTNTTTIQWSAYTDPQNPFTADVASGFVGSNCQFPQITAEGLQDSYQHGVDLKGVYADRLGLGDELDPSDVQIRVTNNEITSQVASGLVRGLFPSTTNLSVLIQRSGVDSLEPQYSCAAASALRAAITESGNWTAHLNVSASLFSTFDQLSGTDPEDEGWHMSWDHYYDNLSAKQCHAKSLPCNLNDTQNCVSQETANTVYRLGNWEYSYLFRDAPESAEYAAVRYGAWVLELKSHLEGVIAGNSTLKYVHNIGHDGSVSPLLAFLQIDIMVWPGMGSEIIFELYSKNEEHFLRVLWSGQPIKTSTPLGNNGTLDMVPVQDFFGYVDATVGSRENLYIACNAE